MGRSSANLYLFVSVVANALAFPLLLQVQEPSISFKAGILLHFAFAAGAVFHFPSGLAALLHADEIFMDLETHLL